MEGRNFLLQEKTYNKETNITTGALFFHYHRAGGLRDVTLEQREWKERKASLSEEEDF